MMKGTLFGLELPNGVSCLCSQFQDKAPTQKRIAEYLTQKPQTIKSAFRGD
jgi:hypothetical protein